MMDREAAARIHRDTRQQQATVNELVHRAKAAEARVAELEADLEQVRRSEAGVRALAREQGHALREMQRQRDSARNWAVRMESEAAGCELALFSSNPADAQWHEKGA